jgi:hypothetical protein
MKKGTPDGVPLDSAAGTLTGIAAQTVAVAAAAEQDHQNNNPPNIIPAETVTHSRYLRIQI